MSLNDEPSQENDQKEAETPQGDELDPEVHAAIQMKDFPKTSQMEKITISPLDLIREDLSQFKEGVLKVFKDKDLNPKTNQPAEKPINTLTLLKEDLNHLKDDFSSVFRIGGSKEREDGPVKEDAPNGVKLKNLRVERTDEPLKSLFRRSLLKQKTEVAQEVRKSEEQTDGSKGNFSEQKGETEKTNMKDEANGPEDGKPNLIISEEKRKRSESFSETQETEEMICASKTVTKQTSEDSVVSAEDEEEEGPSQILSYETLSSGITLFSLRDADKDDMRDQSGEDLWSLKNYACYLTLDPNTANSELHLTNGNRMATRVWLNSWPSDHPERFEHCPQVLCREGLLDKVYWEVEWSGGADIGITYNNICRNGELTSCLLGHNEQSWSLECSEGSYTPCHNRRRFRSISPKPFTRRVGVYLNWSAGSLSFYCVSRDTMTQLHTFNSTFTEPLYPAFWVWAYDGSVSLCQVELDWERLLQ